MHQGQSVRGDTSHCGNWARESKTGTQVSKYVRAILFPWADAARTSKISTGRRSLPGPAVTTPRKTAALTLEILPGILLPANDCFRIRIPCLIKFAVHA